MIKGFYSGICCPSSLEPAGRKGSAAGVPVGRSGFEGLAVEAGLGRLGAISPFLSNTGGVMKQREPWLKRPKDSCRDLRPQCLCAKPPGCHPHDSRDARIRGCPDRFFTKTEE